MYFTYFLITFKKGAHQARIAMFLAGFPEEVPIHSVNRQCSSGLQVSTKILYSILQYITFFYSI